MLRTAGAEADGALAAADLVISFVSGYTLEEQTRKVGRLPTEFLDRGFAAELDIVISGIRTTVFGR